MAHAARGGDGRHEGRQGGYDDFDHDFDDVFLFVFHDVVLFLVVSCCFSFYHSFLLKGNRRFDEVKEPKVQGRLNRSCARCLNA